MTALRKLASALLLGTALAAFAATHVWAQSVPPTTTAQDTRTTTTAGRDDGVAAQDEIVVTGLRSSIRRAQDLKRNAPSIIESITSEDLGKFTDVGLSDALNRIPGVQLQRNYDQESGDTISIRGLSGEYVRNEVNGREALSYGNGDGGGSLRTYNFDSIPTEIIGSVTVYKTSTASQLEPGVAGAINLQTVRPLDVKSKVSPNSPVFGTVAVAGFYNDLARKSAPRFSGIVGAKLLHGTLGVYVGGLHGTEYSRVDNSPMRRSQIKRSVTIRPARAIPTSTKLVTIWFCPISTCGFSAVRTRVRR